MNATKTNRVTWRTIAGAVIAVSVAAIAGQSVIASFNATAFNTVAQEINTGTMKLDLANSGAGFGQSISNLVPGDTVNRYVTLTNSGTVDGIGLTLKTAQTGTATLISDAVNGATNKALRASVKSCSVAWDTSTGICGGTEISELAATPLSALATATALSSANMASGAIKYLQVMIELPDQNETTVNGVLPANTVQGGLVNITYTFDLAQRLATSTNS